MQKITITIVLSFCLGTSLSSIFAMEESGEQSHAAILKEPLIQTPSDEGQIPLKKPIIGDENPFIIEKEIVPFAPSPSLTFFKKNWLPILGFTSLTAYCLYDRKALPEFLSWSKNLWQPLPKLVKGLCISGGILSTLRYLFTKPARCNNPEHNKYVTPKEFAPYKKFIDDQVYMIKMMEQNPEALKAALQGRLQKPDKPVYIPELPNPQEKEDPKNQAQAPKAHHSLENTLQESDKVDVSDEILPKSQEKEESKNQEQDEYVTKKEFARYKDILDEQLRMDQMVQHNPEQFFQMFQSGLPGLPTPQQFGGLFNSDKGNKTKKRTPTEDTVD